MKQHSAEYMVDVEKMFVGGDSSGAHAAMFSQIIQDDNMDADVKGIISFYGANSMMLPDGTPSTLNHHLPDSPEGKEMGGMNLREHPELCRKMSVECFLEGADHGGSEFWTEEVQEIVIRFMNEV